jgi:class 3 adenylate cyclase
MSSAAEPRPSPEVAAVLRRTLLQLQHRDLNALRNLISRSAGLRVIGSAGAAWFEGESVLRILEAQIEEMPAFELSITHVEAYELDGVAWGASTSDATLSDGTGFQLRHTMVFVLEEGMWRCIQTHASVPQDYERTFGVSLTTTLSHLLDSLDVAAVASDDSGEGLSVLMFTDIEDSTLLAHQMGDAAWRALIHDHDRSISVTAEAHGGTVVKSLGDGALLKFGGARAAVRCAVALQAEFAERPFEVRIGIHAGDLLHTPDDVVGATVHKAARVAAAASGGQIVVSSIVRELVGGGPEFGFGDPFTAELKGIGGRHELVPILAGEQDG